MPNNLEKLIGLINEEESRLTEDFRINMVKEVEESYVGKENYGYSFNDDFEAIPLSNLDFSDIQQSADVLPPIDVSLKLGENYIEEIFDEGFVDVDTLISIHDETNQLTDAHALDKYIGHGIEIHQQGKDLRIDFVDQHHHELHVIVHGAGNKNIENFSELYNSGYIIV